MKRAAVHIELLEDCVFSRQSATEGAHRSLDRVPGAALLGAVAGALYRQLGERAFAVFHSGRVRFGDGLPLTADGYVGWPMPLAWHYEKVAGFRADDGTLDAGRIRNFQRVSTRPASHAVDKAPPQPKQLREGYVTRRGHWLLPARDTRLKTAIDPETGRAAEAQLFGYDALRAGQCFLAWVEADDSIDPALFERLLDALCGERLLGRSRSAEYGRVRITRVEASEPTAGESVPGPSDQITLWLLSDLALTDARGQPTAQPAPGHFGLAAGEVLWNKTFLRTRRYSPWNAARGGYDEERLVLVAGGVITLKVPEEGDRQALAERLRRGVGRYREAGLGRIWLDPPLLAGEHPDFSASARPECARGVGGDVATADAQDPLAVWLRSQSGQWRSVAEDQADQFVKAYLEVIEAARRLAGVPAGVDFGPSRSQWGSVQTKAAHKRGDALHAALFQGDDAVIKPKGEGWNIEIRDAQGYRPLAAWLQEKMCPERLPGENRDRAYAHFVRLAARDIQDRIQRRKA